MPSGTFHGPHRLKAAADALHDEGALVRSAVSWQVVRAIEETPDHLFVLLGGAQAFLVPKHGLDEGAVRAFKAAVEAGIRGAQAWTVSTG